MGEKLARGQPGENVDVMGTVEQAAVEICRLFRFDLIDVIRH